MPNSRPPIPFRPVVIPCAEPQPPVLDEMAKAPSSRLEVMRLACERAIEAWHIAQPHPAPEKLLAVRTLQQVISQAKNRNPAAARRPSPLSWTDDWNPPAA